MGCTPSILSHDAAKAYTLETIELEFKLLREIDDKVYRKLKTDIKRAVAKGEICIFDHLKDMTLIRCNYKPAIERLMDEGFYIATQVGYTKKGVFTYYDKQWIRASADIDEHIIKAVDLQKSHRKTGSTNLGLFIYWELPPCVVAQYKEQALENE